MRLAVIGSGYVGLVAGAGFADFGNDVVCVDLDEERIRRLRDGIIPIHEPGLAALVRSHLDGGRLSFTTSTADAVNGADVVIVAVGTPMSETDGAADLRYIDGAARDIGRALTGYAVIVTKSTVPVGTNAKVGEIIRNTAPDASFDVASNPEFLREGAAIDDFMRPDRVVVGVENDRAAAVMNDIYRPLFLRDFPVVITDIASAEMIKYAANAFLATKITFINEIAMLCELTGADVKEVSRGIGLDGRIGNKFLHAGPGYGGSCFPKDVQALIHVAREHGVPLELGVATDHVNQRQKGVLLRKLKHQFDGDLRGKKIALWGIAFKPRTDDLRESPALTLIESLLSEGATVSVHDPEAMPNAKALFGDKITYVDHPYDAITDADALVLVTEWRQYQNPDFARIKSALRTPVLLDGRNIWSTYDLRSQGFVYQGIGVKG
jgi:UDPglucose 6-dehydrogenase